MPKVSVGRDPDGSLCGRIARATKPAKLPKPTQINATCTQIWATGESSGMAAPFVGWKPTLQKKSRALLTSCPNFQLGCSVMDASRARVPSPRCLGSAARSTSSPTTQPRTDVPSQRSAVNRYFGSPPSLWCGRLACLVQPQHLGQARRLHHKLFLDGHYRRWISSCDTAFWAAASLLSGNWVPGGKYCTSSCK